MNLLYCTDLWTPADVHEPTEDEWSELKAALASCRSGVENRGQDVSDLRQYRFLQGHYQKREKLEPKPEGNATWEEVVKECGELAERYEQSSLVVDELIQFDVERVVPLLQMLYDYGVCVAYADMPFVNAIDTISDVIATECDDFVPDEIVKKANIVKTAYLRRQKHVEWMGSR